MLQSTLQPGFIQTQRGCLHYATDPYGGAPLQGSTNQKNGGAKITVAALLIGGTDQTLDFVCTL